MDHMTKEKREYLAYLAIYFAVAGATHRSEEIRRRLRLEAQGGSLRIPRGHQ